MSLTASQIRQQFIDFFVQKHAHAFVASSPVVPHDDPTLLFTNAGMNQFKPIFLGSTRTEHTRVVNTQKCIRAGGKHNDLDDVGHDTYHHTFFEMLGNWSFGDYFKEEAIEWAWELLTRVWNIDPSRLHATYFEGDSAEGLAADDEARELWRSILPPERVHAGNKKDNFWEMGDTGPCGPCSEIHIDRTPDRSGGKLVNAGDPRVIEIWNLVFIQFNRGSDGKLTPLPAKHVDTGMGFERVTGVLQGHNSNYDTDVFSPIFAGIRELTGAPAYVGMLEQPGIKPDAAVMRDIAYRVIGDHVRCLTLALTDGATPGNEGRGYVLRRILRRAVRYGRQYMGTTRPFLCELVPCVVAAMGDAFPELRTAHGGRNAEHVAAIVRDEEESFGRTLDRGIALFAEAADRATRLHHGRIGGEDAFRLHDTYGFPIDLTELMAEEQGLTVDIGEYERRMEEARAKARAGTEAQCAFIPAEIVQSIRPRVAPTDDSEKHTAVGFAGAAATTHKPAQVLAIVADARLVEKISAGQSGAILLDHTSFYAEQGGQIGDRGLIEADGSEGVFEVEDTQRHGDLVFHVGTMQSGVLRAKLPADGDGSQVTTEPSLGLRQSTMSNHTSTHVLNWALREVLGEHVQQKGSLVDWDRTRFDFAHPSPVSADELTRIEKLVNRQIADDLIVHAKEVPQKDALKINGLRAVFGEKYPERVRVVSIGPSVDDLLANPANPKWRQYSIEFCGGTHLRSTGTTGEFCLIEESGVAKGVRRVTGITGERANHARQSAAAFAVNVAGVESLNDTALAAAVAALATRLDAAELPVVEKSRLRERMSALQERVRKLQKEQSKQNAVDVVARAEALLASAGRRGTTAMVAGELDGATVDQMRAAADSVRARAGSAAVLFAAAADGKVILLAAMTPDVVGRGVKAGDLIKEISPIVGGKGGGRPDLAQGGGTDASKISAAVERAGAWMAERLG